MIRNKSVYICNRFHVRRADSGKITSSYNALVRKEPPRPATRTFVAKIESVTVRSEDFVIIACTVLIEQRGVTHRSLAER